MNSCRVHPREGQLAVLNAESSALLSTSPRNAQHTSAQEYQRNIKLVASESSVLLILSMHQCRSISTGIRSVRRGCRICEPSRTRDSKDFRPCTRNAREGSVSPGMSARFRPRCGRELSNYQ